MESSRPRLEPHARGFTLVEMIVVLAIIVTITMIALVGQASFNRSLLLTDTAYTIALSIRQAQSLGLSSRAFSGVQDAGYGVHFSSADPGAYTIFADISPAAPGSSLGGACGGHEASSGPEARPGNCLFDSATEVLQEYTLNRGFEISDICGTINGTKNCISSNVTSANIVFQRPNTSSQLVITMGSSEHPASCIEVEVSTRDGDASRTIRVTELGEVSVNQTCE